MTLLTGLLRYTGIFVLLCSVVACSERHEATHTDSVLVQPVTEGPTLSVYKSPSCGCCGDWINHIESAGFHAVIHHPADLNQIKIEKGVSPIYQSCHTAISGEGYVFEGHIPARYMRQFLKSPADEAIGLAVPAMPVGSPGMEMGDRFTPYQVLLLKKDGSSEVFARVDVQEEQYQ